MTSLKSGMSLKIQVQDPNTFNHLQTRLCQGSSCVMNHNQGLSNDPFVEVDGAFNFRGVGGYRSTLTPDAVIREGLIYRTGHLSDVTSAGWRTVKSLGISTIIDITSPGEVEIFTGAPDKTLSPLGIETLHLPLKPGVFSMAKQVRKYQVYRKTGPEVRPSHTLVAERAKS